MAMKGKSTFPKAPLLYVLVSYPGQSLEGSYSSAEMQSKYSTAPADWAWQMEFLWTLQKTCTFIIFTQPLRSGSISHKVNL